MIWLHLTPLKCDLPKMRHLQLLFSINSSSRCAARGGVPLLARFGEQWPKTIEWFEETSENQCSTSVKMPTGLSWEVQLESCHRFFCVHVRRSDLRTKLWDTIKGLQYPSYEKCIHLYYLGRLLLPAMFIFWGPQVCAEP